MENLKYLLDQIPKNKNQIINLINAQYILRFAHNPWYFEDKLLNKDIDTEDLYYHLKLVDSEGLEIIRKFFKNPNS